MGDKFRSWLQQQATSSKTARDRLVWVKSLLNYACDDLEVIPKNPWRGLDIKTQTESPRKPWSDESLTKLFSHSIWRELSIPLDKKAGGSAAYWIPLLALYSGARCSELCQLRTDDIKKESGVWIMQIHDLDPTQKIKTVSARRSIPLHAELLRLGFIEYCESNNNLIKQLENEIEQNKIQANIFLSSMSHNLKTPINSKNLFINLLGLIINNEILCSRVKKDIDPLS
jgi:integrase